MRGAYVLIIDIHENISLRFKSLGNLSFDKGTWVYVGSAMGMGSTSLENRIHRHFRSEKTIHWHIDHLLDSGSTIRTAIWSESSYPVECEIVSSINILDDIHPGPRGFGASDCKQKCGTHLFHSTIGKGLEKKIQDVFRKLNLDPRITQDGSL